MTEQPTFYDPTNPGGVVPADHDLNVARWSRVGATPDDLERLGQAHSRRSIDAKLAENARLRAMPDSEVQAELLASRDKAGAAGLDALRKRYDGPARQVLGEVGDDPSKAAEALLVERARPDGPRQSVVSELEKKAAVDSPPTQVDGASGQPVS